jgi:TRAP-type C4-dicarboxylate transport system permease small subunit
VKPNLLRKFTDLLERINSWLCAALVLGMLIIVLLQVLTRMLGHSFSWTEELSRYFMIWIGLMGGSLALKKGEHASVRFLVEKMNQTHQLIVSVVGLATILGFMIILMTTGFQVAGRAAAIRSTALEIPMKWPKLAIPCGAALIALETVNLIVETLQKLWSRKAADQ